MTQDIGALLKKVDDWAQASTDCSNDKQAVFLRQITAAIRELQKDKGRLDFLEGIVFPEEWQIELGAIGDRQFFRLNTEEGEFEGSDMRSAIDGAMILYETLNE